MTSTFPTTARVQSSESRALENHVPENRSLHLAVPTPSGRTMRQGTRSRDQTVDDQDAAISTRTKADPDAYESASRLLSETAHDLRAPLSTIREAVRLVRDGDLGQITSAQGECLSAAINQCNCTAKLVDEMVQSRQFESGFPNVRRDWISIDDLRQSVEATLQPWMMPRGIHLLWDGPFENGIDVYADATLLRRLIVNLVSNAIRVTSDGQPVLIRAKPDRENGVMLWSIVDQGCGISLSDMELIGSGKAPARNVGGLGLMISRQLAAAHFSKLRIESREGTGTAVSFQTAFGGPAALADRWVMWRSDLISSRDGQVLSQDQRMHNVLPTRSSRKSDSPSPPRRVRIDTPSQTVELGAHDLHPVHQDQVYLATVSVGAAIPVSGINAFDALLQRTMRVTELAYRTGRRSWVIAWDADGEVGIGKQMELERLVQNELEGLRMTWGISAVVSASDDPSTGISLSNRLSDWIVRESLSAAQQLFTEADQVRLGTAPMKSSEIAAGRLEKEVNRLIQTRRSKSSLGATREG